MWVKNKDQPYSREHSRYERLPAGRVFGLGFAGVWEGGRMRRKPFPTEDISGQGGAQKKSSD